MTFVKGKLFVIGIHSEYCAATKTGKGLFFNNFVWSTLHQWANKLYLPISCDSFIHFDQIEGQSLSQGSLVSCQAKDLTVFDRSFRNVIDRITNIQDQLEKVKVSIEHSIQ